MPTEEVLALVRSPGDMDQKAEALGNGLSALRAMYRLGRKREVRGARCEVRGCDVHASPGGVPPHTVRCCAVARPWCDAEMVVIGISLARIGH
jgi:hypothetical protein